jgi:hypothetical protein
MKGSSPPIWEKDMHLVFVPRETGVSFVCSGGDWDWSPYIVSGG